MSLAQVKALTRMGPRSLGWQDFRDRSPKAKDDLSGIILSRIGTKGVPAVQNFNYDLLSEIYICNDMAWTCINLVSSTAALGKLKARIRKGNKVEYVPDHPLQILLDTPNESMTQFDLIQSYVVHQLLYGNASDLFMREAMTVCCPDCSAEGQTDCIHKLFLYTDGPVAQIMPIHPSNLIQKFVGGKKYFFYKPDVGVEREYLIHPKNMLSDPLYNPDISWYGVSPTFLLKRWLDLDTVMTHQTNLYFENGAIPSMIVSLNPSTNFTYEGEPETLVAKMKERWMAQFSGKGNKQKTPAFVYGDVKVDKVQDKLNDTIGKDLYYEIQNRVCATYGVPPTLYEMGLEHASQRSSSAQHEMDFYNRTISKILTRFQNKITQLVVPSFNTPGLEVSWDLSEMGIASFLVDKKENRTLAHWEKGLIKRDDARLNLGYEPTGDEFGDDYYRITVMGDGQGGNASNQLGTTPQDNNLTPAGEKLLGD